jgi:hypothetical protein
MGEKRMLVISVGNGRSRTGDALFLAQRMNMLYAARQVPKALMDNMSVQQDTTCRVMGRCVHGEPINSEVGDLIVPRGVKTVPERSFTYMRYNKTFTVKEIDGIKEETGAGLELDNLKLIDVLTKSGEEYALEHVKEEDLF